jgi:hypothetical protein
MGLRAIAGPISLAPSCDHLDIEQVHFHAGTETLHIQQVKRAGNSPHVLDHEEIVGLLRLARSLAAPCCSPANLRSPISTDTVARIVSKAAEAVGISLRVHPDMLRQSAGHLLADEGWDNRLVAIFSAMGVFGTASGRLSAVAMLIKRHKMTRRPTSLPKQNHLEWLGRRAAAENLRRRCASTTGRWS